MARLFEEAGSLQRSPKNLIKRTRIVSRTQRIVRHPRPGIVLTIVGDQLAASVIDDSQFQAPMRHTIELIPLSDETLIVCTRRNRSRRNRIMIAEPKLALDIAHHQRIRWPDMRTGRTLGIAKLRHQAPYGQEVTRAAANLEATERARQSACANEGANKLSSVPGDVLSETIEWRLCGAPLSSVPGDLLSETPEWCLCGAPAERYPEKRYPIPGTEWIYVGFSASGSILRRSR
jgi:hypothetical protein